MNIKRSGFYPAAQCIQQGGPHLAFALHWPDAPNLGDITGISWSQVEPVDILIGGFPGLRDKIRTA